MHKRVWSLAAPIILSNVTVPLVGAVDTAVVGHLADTALIGAVAFGALIFSFVYWAFDAWAPPDSPLRHGAATTRPKPI